MTPAWLLDNLLAWSAQVAVLVVFAAAAALTIKSSRARLVFWQGVLVMAILLPAVEPWMHAVDGSVNYGPLTAAPILVTSHATPHPGFVWRREYLLALIAAGAVLRALWMAIGFRRLRRHRIAAHVLTHPPVLFESSHVVWYLSDTISGPVTFGWLRPSILLPSRIDELSDAMREAIACHELVHVRRHDWLFVIAEEMLRAALWFHPAIWFVLSQIQLAREQAVDLEVIGLTRDRERYLDALIAVAEQKIERTAWPNYRGSDVAPAPLFLKKRQLASRVAAVLKETHMSKARLFASFDYHRFRGAGRRVDRGLVFPAAKPSAGCATVGRRDFRRRPGDHDRCRRSVDASRADFPRRGRHRHRNRGGGRDDRCERRSLRCSRGQRPRRAAEAGPAQCPAMALYGRKRGVHRPRNRQVRRASRVEAQCHHARTAGSANPADALGGEEYHFQRRAFRTSSRKFAAFCPCAKEIRSPRIHSARSSKPPNRWTSTSAAISRSMERMKPR